MKVLFVTPEAYPFAKTGGLADVSGSLPIALRKLGCEVSVIMPYYASVRRYTEAFPVCVQDLPVTLGNRLLPADIRHGWLDHKIPIYFVQRDEFYDRTNLYGTPKGDYFDNAERFIYFCKAVINWCQTANLQPDIIHCNDWQTALIPPMMRFGVDRYYFDTIATIFTIHNIAYQGIFDVDVYALTGLPWELFVPEGLEFWGRVNFMKGGIIYSDCINTVSQKHSKEIQTPEFGFGLDGVLRTYSHKLVGILNGADYEVWDPETDPLIAANYSKEDLSGKRKCKRDLLDIYGLPQELFERPLLSVISRLVEQKGVDLYPPIMDKLLAEDIGFVLLGTGEEKYHKYFMDLAKKYPNKVGVRIAYDNALAHKIEAGADIFLMPSRYEPGGLNQIYSMRYGTVPVVRATGGLDDTVQDYDPETNTGTGFKFGPYDPEAFLNSILRAIKLYDDKERWNALVLRGMEEDFSWEKSAKKYMELYEKSLAERKARL